MRKKNKSQNKLKPYRDSTYFVIVCEGEKTEIEYFQNFKMVKQQRVKIVSVAPSDNKSAPKWVLDQAVKKAEEIGLNEDDQLWIVTDTDRWKIEHLRTIQEACEQTKNWNFVVSNPCFEVWLHAHLQDLENITTIDRYELKKQFGLLKHQGLFEKPLQNVRLAIERTKRLDSSPHFIPESLRTKVYLLVEELIKRIGEQYFE
jgi:RloB-like protein